MSMTASSNSDNCKRQNYISWDEYFMGMTILNGNKLFKNEESKINSAIILNSRKIIIGTSSNNSLKLSDHAELQALNHAKEHQQSILQSVLYTLNFPCEHCADILVKEGVCEIIYFYDELVTEKATDIFKNNNVLTRKFKGTFNKLELDFNNFS